MAALDITQRGAPSRRQSARVVFHLCRAAAGASLGLLACAVDDRGVEASPDADGVWADPDCNPLGEQNCLLPWPSATYLEEDAESETGYRVALPERAMPATRGGAIVHPEPYNRWDGFPATGPLLAAFPSGVGEAGLPPLDDVEASIRGDSPIALVNMDTGERHPFFAEVDANPLSSVPLRPLIIRPAEPLEPGARYAVGIRDALETPEGEPLEAPAAFRDLRRGGAPEHRAAGRARYDAIFSALENAGIPREELVLAWDFVTASRASASSDLRAMSAQADAALDELGADLDYELNEVEIDSEHVYRRVEGHYEAPNFLTAGEEDDSVLVRDDAGTPEQSGTTSARLAGVVPACAEDVDEPLPVLIAGHGIMASATEHLEFRELLEFADERCRILLAGDWIGLTNRQTTLAPQAASDINRMPWVADKLAQAVINFSALSRAIRGPLAEAELLRVDGEPVVDGGEIAYFGISLGGIMGGVLAGYDGDLDRAALGVAGGPWGLLLERSLVWSAFQGPLINAYGDQLNYQAALALTNMVFAPYDPVTAAPRVRGGAAEGPDAGEGPAEIFLYAALGDSLVANAATEVLARALSLPVIAPSVDVPWGLEEVEGPAPSALALYDESPAPLPPEGNVPPDEDNGTHTAVNFLGAVTRQVGHFLDEGEVQNECALGGEPSACDCAAGACE